MNSEEKKLINDFLAADPEAPSSRFTKSALLKHAQTQHSLLLLLRKYWLGSIVEGLENAQSKPRQYQLCNEQFVVEDDKLKWEKIQGFINKIGIENVINVEWTPPTLIIWYAK